MMKRVLWIALPLLFISAIVVYAVVSPLARAGSHKVHTVPRAVVSDWNTFQGNIARSGYNPAERTITSANASQLSLKWAVKGIRGVSGQPVVVNGKVFWGSWDGNMHATDMTGHQIWSVNLGTTRGKCRPLSTGITGSASVASVSMNGKMTEVVFVGGGNTNLYAINAANGQILWQTSLGASPDYFIWGSPAIYNGSVYIGVASYGDCPLVQGTLVQLNASTGATQHVFKVVADNCVGGGIWDAPTIDPTTGMLYVSTGTRVNCNPAETMATSLVKLRASDLSVVDSWQVPPAETIPDGDFGSTPTLFSSTINGVRHLMVGLINKNGVYFAFDRDKIGAGPLWQKALGDKQVITKVNMSSSAWDGTTLYIGSGHTVIAGNACNGSIRAMNPDNGSFIWERCLSEVPFDSAMAVPGLVVIGVDAALLVMDAKTGKILYKYEDQAARVTLHLYSWGNPCISNGMLFAGNMAGNFYAFGL